MNDNRITIKLAGETILNNEVLASLCICFNRINKFISNKDNDSQMALIGMREGSVILDFIFSCAPMVSEFFTILTGIIEFMKLPLEAKKVGKDSANTIYNNNGKNISIDNRVFNFFTSASAEADCIKLFKTLNSDDARGGFIVSTQAKEYSITSDEILELSKPTKRVYENGNVTIEEMNVKFISYDLELKSRWKYKNIATQENGVAKMTKNEYVLKLKEGLAEMSTNTIYRIKIETTINGDAINKKIIECNPVGEPATAGN